MRKYCYHIVVFFLVIELTISCSGRANIEEARAEIMRMHNNQRIAHMQKDVALLLSDSIGDYMEVNRGGVNRPTNSESTQRFQAYFDAVDFVKWDDISEPVITFSDDATMATTVVKKLVITRDKSDSSRVDTAQYAWLAIYKKVNGKWGLHRMGSTNK